MINAVNIMRDTDNGQLVDRGKRVYETKLKGMLEPEHNGQYVVIEPDSDDYYLGHTMSEAYEKAAAEHPGQRFFLARVGHRAAVSFKHRTSL